MFAINEKCLDLDGISFFPSFPALYRANDDKFSRALTTWYVVSVCKFFSKKKYWGAVSGDAYMVI